MYTVVRHSCVHENSYTPTAKDMLIFKVRNYVCKTVHFVLENKLIMVSTRTGIFLTNCYLYSYLEIAQLGVLNNRFLIFSLSVRIRVIESRVELVSLSFVKLIPSIKSMYFGRSQKYRPNFSFNQLLMTNCGINVLEVYKHSAVFLDICQKLTEGLHKYSLQTLQSAAD